MRTISLTIALRCSLSRSCRLIRPKCAQPKPAQLPVTHSILYRAEPEHKVMSGFAVNADSADKIEAGRGRGPHTRTVLPPARIITLQTSLAEANEPKAVVTKGSAVAMFGNYVASVIIHRHAVARRHFGSHRHRNLIARRQRPRLASRSDSDFPMPAIYETQRHQSIWLLTVTEAQAIDLQVVLIWTTVSNGRFKRWELTSFITRSRLVLALRRAHPERSTRPDVK